MARAAHKAVSCANMSQTHPIPQKSILYASQIHHKQNHILITYESHTLYSMENYCWFIVDLLLIFMILLILREHTCIFTTLFVILCDFCT